MQFDSGVFEAAWLPILSACGPTAPSITSEELPLQFCSANILFSGRVIDPVLVEEMRLPMSSVGDRTAVSFSNEEFPQRLSTTGVVSTAVVQLVQP